MKSELTPRQWALYNYIKDMNDTWTTQYGIARALSMLDGYYTDFENAEDFHESPARMQMTADIRAINESSIIQKIIISSSKGIKLANSEEFDRYIRKEIMAAVRRLMRAKHKAAKGNLDGQMRIVFNSERDTVKAFIDSDKAFGERLKLCRAGKGYSQATVVCEMRKLGDNTFDAPMLSKFENGYCLPNNKAIVKLAEIYGVTPDYLTCGEDLSTVEEIDENGDLQNA